jgi:hypothetical protein
MYAGSDVDVLPRGAVAHRDLQRAASNLDRFTAVFVLEELRGPGRCRPLQAAHAGCTSRTVPLAARCRSARLLTSPALTLLCSPTPLRAPAAQAALDWLFDFRANYSGYRSGTSFSNYRVEQKIRPEVLRAMLQTMRLDVQLYAHATTLHRLTVASWQAIEAAGAGGESPGVRGARQLALGQKGDAGRHSMQRPLCPRLQRLEGRSRPAAAQPLQL